MIPAKWFFLLFPVFSTASVLAENIPTLNQESSPALIISDGKQALTKMVAAMRSLNYQGTVAFMRDGKLEPMKYSHAVDKGHEQEHLLSLNSPLREVVRETGTVSCLYKTTHQLVIDNRPFERSFLINLPTDINQLDVAYDIEVQGEENIAMQSAYAVAIKPKDKLRYARKVWLSQKSSLPLKVVIYDLQGESLEELVFTELEVKDSLPFIEMKSPNQPQLASPTDTAISSANAAFVMASFPAGFKEVFFSRTPMRDAEQPVDHLLLSDGLASVSIYMEHRNVSLPTFNADPNTVQTIEAINYFSHSVGDYQLTVMGEVPSDTIRLIADSVKLRKPQQ